MINNQDNEIGLNDGKFIKDFSDISTQRKLKFIKKVFYFLSIQWLTTVIFCYLSSMPVIKENFLKNQNISIILSVLSFIFTIASTITIYERSMRQNPYNYYIFCTFTFCFSFVFSSLSFIFNPQIVLMFAFMIFCITFSLVIYTFFIKTDYDRSLGVITMLSCVVLMLISFLSFTDIEILYIVLSSIISCVFGTYLISETELILDNKDNVLENDHYIFSVFMIYTDLIYGLFYMAMAILSFFHRPCIIDNAI
jgi:FtsH-binding integral membrane protein